jgi:opacity protein-like surface antigen
MHTALRSAAVVGAAVAALGILVLALSRSPLATFEPSSFEAFGWHLRLTSAYADPSSTVLDFSGVPPATIFGGVLYDELGVAHQSYLARYDGRGNVANDFDRLGWQAGIIAMRYTLVLGNRPVATFTVPPGGGSSFNAPPGGAFATGSVEFSTIRYGGRAVFVDVAFHGVDVVGGFECGEAACLASPGLEMQLIPAGGGAPIGLASATPARSNDTVVHGVAMLVDPGAYTLVLSLGTALLERPVVIG